MWLRYPPEAADLVREKSNEETGAKRGVGTPCGPTFLMGAASHRKVRGNPCDEREDAFTCGDLISVS
jgi:hypothetical protein